jgi:hypothetical protein
MSKSSSVTRAIATPNRVTAHPGEVLNEEFLRPLGMSVNALAIALRVPATRIGAIALGALLWHQPRVLDEPTGDARSDKSADGKRRSNRTRCAAPRGLNPRAGFVLIITTSIYLSRVLCLFDLLARAISIRRRIYVAS